MIINRLKLSLSCALLSISSFCTALDPITLPDTLSPEYRKALAGDPEGIRTMLSYWNHPSDDDNPTRQYWLLQLAATGDTGAMEALCKFKTQVAFDYCRKVAEQGSALAEMAMYEYYDNSYYNSPARYTDRIEQYWLLQSAENGYPFAATEMADYYSYGHGDMEADAEKAMHWFRVAAENGDPVAQKKLAKILAEGAGPIKADLNEAMKWIRLSAEQGDEEAQYMLAWALQSGRNGIQKNSVEAYAWMAISAEKGGIGGEEDALRKKDAIFSGMDDMDKAKALELEKTFRADFIFE